MKQTVGVAIVAMGIVFQVTGWAAESLYQELSRKSEVSIYVARPVNGSSHAQMNDTEPLRQALEKTLRERKSVHFNVVSDKSRAELTVETRITGYYWTDKDPVDMLMGTASIAMDIAIEEGYVRVDAECTVTENKSGKTLWRDTLTATVTGKQVTEKDAPGIGSEDLAKNFVRHAFGKSKNKRR